MNQEWLYRKIIITGANGGIGLAIARAFLGEGATVILPVHNNAGNIDALVEEFGSTKVYPFQLDLRRIEAIEEFAGKVQKQFGTVDVLINNAGVSDPAPLAEISSATFDKVIETNVRGPFFLAQKILPLLKEAGGGSIVTVSSMSGHEPYPGMGVYSTSKAAVIMLMRQLAIEWAQYNIRINTVSPGLIRTPLSESLYREEEIHQKRRELVPLKRIGTSQEIANVVLFLCSAKASYITGQSILVDGGLLGTIQDHLTGRPASR